MIYAAEYDMACDSLERRGFWFSGYDPDSLSMLKTLKQERPEWVKSFAKKQAEDAIATTKVNAYPGAVEILKHAREIYLTANQNSEWQAYLQHLMTAHKRKRKLIPLLEQLG